MKYFYILFTALLLLNISHTTHAKSLNPKFAILPHPQKIEIINDVGIKFSELTFVISENELSIPILGNLLDILPQRTIAGKKGVKLSLTTHQVPEHDEGYKLVVNKTGITIFSRTEKGLFYGCQTLQQLMEDSRDYNLYIPQMVITDYPSIAYRAVHFDTKHHLDDIHYYYQVIDRLARYKINAIIWEIEDKLRFVRRSEIGSPNAISKQQMQSICRYAKERHIEISPLVQGLGHAGFILKHHWELRENEHSDWEFCPSDPRTYELQFDLYRDAIEAMPYGQFLHVGGDEISAIGIDSRCKATGKTAFELQMIWLKKVCDFAKEHGKTPIFWDDMPLKNADLWGLLHRGFPDDTIKKYWKTDKLDNAIELFPKECIYMRWHYEDPTILPHMLLLDWYKNAGLRVMAATSASTGGDPFMPRKQSRTQYIKDFSRLTVENNLLGILTTVWDDGSSHWETVMRGLVAQGEFGWNPTTRTVDQFIAAHAQREFGLQFQQMDFITQMEQAAAFFDHALIDSGSRNPAWGTVEKFKLITLPDKNNLGSWNKIYRNQLDTAKLEWQRHQLIMKGLSDARKLATRNRFTLDIYYQTAQLFYFPIQLLLALENFDTASNQIQKTKALKEIKAVCDNFPKMRKELEEVYSQSRFMENPEGYIADHNHHHHLSSMTNGSDWFYFYEIPMVKATEIWLSDVEQ